MAHTICTECPEHAFAISIGSPTAEHGASCPINRMYCSENLTTFVTTKRRIARTHNHPMLQNNERSHKAWLVSVAANDLHIEIVPHAPYSSDVVPSDLFSFPKL